MQGGLARTSPAGQRRGIREDQGYLISKSSYRKIRPMIERSFGWMKNFRKIIIRYERLATTFLGLIRLASIMILWRVLK